MSNRSKRFIPTPPLPPGAVKGDVHRQNYCPMCDRPKEYFVDEERTCVQCRQPFVFSAKEQKFWYETLQFRLSSIAIRCFKCRKQRRSEHALRAQIGDARRKLQAKPDDAHALLELASATARYRERTGEGDLNDAIRAARKAAEVERHSVEPLFWEAKCQVLAGRAAKAIPLYERFLEDGRKVHRLVKLIREAETELTELRRASAE